MHHGTVPVTSAKKLRGQVIKLRVISQQPAHEFALKPGMAQKAVEFPDQVIMPPVASQKSNVKGLLLKS
jgi:hypothetical protein